MSPEQWWQRRKEYLESHGIWPLGSKARKVEPSAEELPQPKTRAEARARPIMPPRPPKKPPQTVAQTRALTTQELYTRNIVLFAAIIIFAFLINVIFLSQVQQQASQQKLESAFRTELAAATAPTSEGDVDQVLLSNGVPVAIVRIPELGVDQVVVEGTDGSSLKAGPGHRRDTVLPGQAGTSVIMARAWAYGGPFQNIQSLAPGSIIHVITGQGFHTFEVIGVRYAGDAAPAEPVEGASRLVLESARGSAFAPTGVVRVDAQMVETASEEPGDEATTPAKTKTKAVVATESDATAATETQTSDAVAETQTSESAGATADTATATATAESTTTTESTTITDSTDTPAAPATSGETETEAETETETETTQTASATVVEAFPAGARYTGPQTLAIAEREMGTDTSNIWVLIFALQFLIVVELLAVWAYRRYGFDRAWIVAVPVVFVAALNVADQLVLLLPNLL